jgi:serine/threonine-protein kinase
LLGDYELLEQLGRGGMGVVYRAHQRSANRVVALKLIRSDRLESMSPDKRREWLERFRTEAQATSRIDHEHVVTVYEVGVVNGCPFYSMRYVQGRSLADFLRDGPIPSREAAHYMEMVARAVHAGHSHGILHRDLKPRNILVDARGRPFVTDFGLAKWPEGPQDLTHTGDWLGTPSYMSPEQAQDAARVTAASDVYSLGATLYALLAGRPPFQAATVAETLYQVKYLEPVPPRQLNPAIDQDLETITLTCVHKEPERRYPTAVAMAEDLRRYLQNEPIQARPIGTCDRVRRWCRRPERMRDAGIFSLIVAAVFAIWCLSGFATLAFGSIAIERPPQAWFTVGLDFCIALVSLWVGRGALAKRPFPLWVGLAVTTSGLAFSLACLLGLDFDGGGLMKDATLRIVLFSLFSALATVAVLTYVIALVAYYADLSMMREQGLRDAKDQPVAVGGDGL